MSKVIVDNCKMTKRLYQTCLLALLCQLCTVAIASEDCIVARSFFEDKSGRMTFEQAASQDYSPMGTMLAQGYSDSKFWIKARLDPQKCQNSDLNQILRSNLALRIQPPFLDAVELFDPLDKSNQLRAVGDQYPWVKDEYKSLNLNFVIPSGEARDIWLSLKTTSTTLMRVQAFTFNDLAAADKIQELGFGIYVGVLGLIFIGALITWWSVRDWLTGIFAINQLSSFAHSLVIMGYYRIFMGSAVTPQILDVSSSVIILTFAFITAIFQYSFYRQFGDKWWARLFFLCIILLYPINLALLASGQIRLALNINLIGLWLLSLFLLILPFFAINWKALSSPILSKISLFIIYLISNFIAWVNIVPALGFFTANPFAPYFGLLYGVVTGFIFLILLQYRYRLSQEQRLVEVSQAVAIAHFEKNRRLEQSQFLQMLTHELKTSLSVIKMAFATEGSYKKFKDYADNAVTDINEVIERTLLADRFDSSKIEVKKSKVDLNALLSELKVLGNVQLIQGDQIIIESDVNLLRRILNNLVDNALKYGELSTPVVIKSSVSFDGETKVAIVAVQNKIGAIGSPDMDKVFEKYYRSPKAHERTGSGLGLYLVRNLVNLLGGLITCKIDDGSIFFELQIPIG